MATLLSLCGREGGGAVCPRPALEFFCLINLPGG